MSNLTHKQQQTFHDISQASFPQCELYPWNQSQSRLEHKTLRRSLGANQLSSPNAGLNRFKQASHWLGGIKETALAWVTIETLTETGNRARQTSGTQGSSIANFLYSKVLELFRKHCHKSHTFKYWYFYPKRHFECLIPGSRIPA